jgi:hypothetical protein
MNLSATLRNTLVLGSLALTTAACETQIVYCEESPSIEPLGGQNGMGGTNGLDSKLFKEYAWIFYQATQEPLVQPGTEPDQLGHYQLNPEIHHILLADGQNLDIRKDIFVHALQCAMPSTTVFIDGTSSYHGNVLPDAEANLQDPTKPLLSTTAGWLHGALAQPAVEDLVTCMAIMLNPRFQNVPVFLSGPSVPKRFESTPPYLFEEAVWTADVNEVVGIRYHVWPLITGPQLPDCLDTDDLAAAFRVRVCGSAEEDCGVDVRLDKLEDECDFGPNGYNCGAQDDENVPVLAKPAIHTMLKSQCDVDYMYCPLVPQ